MSVFGNFRRMLRKPVPRWLFGYSWGSTIFLLALFYLVPIPMVQKQVISMLFLLPFVGVVVLEFCLLVRQKRLLWFMEKTKTPILVLLILTLPVLLLSPPEFRWKLIAFWLLPWFCCSLWAHWCLRMTKLGYF